MHLYKNATSQKQQAAASPAVTACTINFGSSIAMIITLAVGALTGGSHFSTFYTHSWTC